ncbi:TPR-repeat-containing protein [Eggerthella sp. YY7918]|nr:TPR-repeat-containing protein [Eggerthella sp. YY7918]
MSVLLNALFCVMTGGLEVRESQEVCVKKARPDTIKANKARKSAIPGGAI